MEEILIYFEKEVKDLRARIVQQNNDILGLMRQLEIRYRLYSELEDDYNNMKKHYENYKTDCILHHCNTIQTSPDPPSQPPSSIETNVYQSNSIPHFEL